MSLYDHRSFDDHAEITFATDKASGLRAIIALHRVWERPSVGGCRLRAYDTEEAALEDVLRLSRGMTSKSVMAGLSYGGAKAVILSAPDDHAREAQMRAMARITNRFGGRFRTGVDFGLTAEDIDVMQAETPFVFGDAIVPPSKATAEGVLVAIKAAVRYRLGRADLKDLGIMVQGLGKVGRALAAVLVGQGAKVLVADVDAQRVAEARSSLGVEALPAERAHAADVDLFCPCALGAVINDRSLGELRASMVVGSANNQLEAPDHGEQLHNRRILYGPDYVVNAGGLIAVAAELERESTDWIKRKLDGLGGTLETVFAMADRRGISTSLAADKLAEERIAALEEASLYPTTAAGGHLRVANSM